MINYLILAGITLLAGLSLASWLVQWISKDWPDLRLQKAYFNSHCAYDSWQI